MGMCEEQLACKIRWHTDFAQVSVVSRHSLTNEACHKSQLNKTKISLCNVYAVTFTLRVFKTIVHK